ncbi:hypothetical protein [Dyadobacter sp. 3J3]|uniref:hypothetical protein n=1 Tax=Dyadobacter sp. 3J3 TaxID=2606600 RepID=UPI001E2D2B78|nr:hypothetical protein [Dyadobacter sp. 3J3]
MKTKQQLVKALSASLFAAALFFSSSAVFAQVKIGSNPTVINPANNLEVESTDPAKKVSVDKTTGKITIADGSQGAERILTSDANGTATWKPIKSTAITSFPQTSGFALDLGYEAGTCLAPRGSTPPACAVDINQNASFTVLNPVNDVIINLEDAASVASNSTTVYFSILVYVDKTTPGVYENVGGEFITYANIGCGAAVTHATVALKNLPARTYNVKVYYVPWVNFGTTARVGIGAQAIPGCGSVTPDGNNLIISVSQ